MQQYVVLKNFTVGEINKTLRTSQVVFFDGSTLVVGEDKFSAPGVVGAIRKGWLLAADGSEADTGLTPQSSNKLHDSRLNSQALLDRYKVVPRESSESDLPRKLAQPLLDFGTEVISDADEGEVPIDEALPSLKSKKAAREALKVQSESIPSLPVKSDGGEPTTLKRTPRNVKKNVLNELPLVDTSKSVPVVPPIAQNRVFGGTVIDEGAALKTTSENLEVLSLPKTEKVEASATPTRSAKEDHLVLAQSVGAQPLAYPTSGVPENWKSLSFRERKNFVEEVSDVSTLKELLLLEKGAVKKFITSKLENLSNA